MYPGKKTLPILEAEYINWGIKKKFMLYKWYIGHIRDLKDARTWYITELRSPWRGLLYIDDISGENNGDLIKR